MGDIRPPLEHVLQNFIAEQFLGASTLESGRLLTYIFVGAFCGSLVGTYVVSRMRIDFFLIAMLSIGGTGLYLMISAQDVPTVMLTGYLVGASIGATFNGYTAFGLSFVATPNHKNVAYLLLAGGLVQRSRRGSVVR